jgi:uncharacterized protein (TIRG00374 family)
LDDVVQAVAEPRPEHPAELELTPPAEHGPAGHGPAGHGAAAKRPRRLKVAVLAGLAATVLTVIIAVGHKTLIKSLHVLNGANMAWVGAALILEALSLSTFGYSRTLLLRAGKPPADGRRVRFRDVMKVTYASNALSQSVPIAGAELAVVYSYRQFRRTGAPSATTSWSLAVSALFSTSALALLLLAGTVATGVSAGAATASFIGAVIYLLPGAGVLLALRYTRVRTLLHAVVARLAELSRRVFGKPENGAAGLDTFLDEVSSITLPWPRYVVVFGLALANWACDCAVLACALQAVGLGVPWHYLPLVYGAGAAVGSTGITPGGFGIVEVTLTAALTQATGLQSGTVLAAVLLYRLVNFWLVLVSGWVCVAILARRSRRLGDESLSSPAPGAGGGDYGRGQPGGQVPPPPGVQSWLRGAELLECGLSLRLRCSARRSPQGVQPNL